LLAKIQKDAYLLTSLEAAKSIDDAVLIIKEAGFSISKDEFKPFFVQLLDDSELESLSGGGTGYPCSGTCHNIDCKTAKGAYGCDTYTGDTQCIVRCR
jgi:predicted ribosomally synthesized peptide with nif11-like leader